jgi:NAD(P)H-dependent flavin oxidoreductase YrpB (nitropropane dioxygenase family)
MTRLTTPLCQTLGIQVPVVQAPIGSAASPKLAAAVAAAGGLGMLALTWLTPTQAVAQIRRVRQTTDRPFGVNVVLDFPIDRVLAAALEEHVPVVSTVWGDPAPVVDRVHAAGALHLHVVGSVAEAERAVDAGVDVVVAQGWEAGGHVRGQVATMALVPAVVDAVHPVPVIAAGGIGDGRGLAAVLALGAQAAWLGTRFLTAEEALTHDVHRRRVVEAVAEDALYTRCFDDGWPDAPHRVIRNSTLDGWERAGSPPPPRRPGEGDVLATDSRGHPRLRYGFGMPLADMTGDPEAMALYAGQSVALVRDVAPAGHIVRNLVAQAVGIIRAMQHARSTV